MKKSIEKGMKLGSPVRGYDKWEVVPDAGGGSTFEYSIPNLTRYVPTEVDKQEAFRSTEHKKGIDICASPLCFYYHPVVGKLS